MTEIAAGPMFLARVLVLYGLRHFGYSDALNDYHPTAPPLPGYDLDRSAGVGIEIEVYPFASPSSRRVELGVVASLRKEAMLADSSVSGVAVDASSSQWQGALRLRIPLGPHEIGASAGAGTHTFSVTARGASQVLFPGVAWSYARVGVDARLEARPLFLGAALGYRPSLTFGQIASQDWFPHMTATGFDASIDVGAPIDDRFEVLLGYEVRRYTFDARSEPGDAAVAGGGADLYGSGWIAVGARF